MIKEECKSDSEHPQEVFKGVTLTVSLCDEFNHSSLPDQAYPKVLQTASKSSPSTNLTLCSVSFVLLPASVVGLPIMKVPGSTQIISRLEADAMFQVMGGFSGSKDDPLFELEELLLELFEPWVWESDSMEATGAIHWPVCLK
tara:strand:+ start:639 stop:1067 length:429 start_codon:yes stop_codon:yes gene_type:complete